jgi:hypothetical protein
MAASDATAPKRQRRSETTSYLVQIHKGMNEGPEWADVDYVHVPNGTRRRTVLEKAVREVALPLAEGEQGIVRIIPVAEIDAAEVAFEQPPATLRITS